MVGRSKDLLAGRIGNTEAPLECYGRGRYPSVSIARRSNSQPRGRRPSRMLLTATVAALAALGIEIYVFTVAYPTFAIVGAAEFPALHTFHANRITYSIGPALLISAFANVALALDRPRDVPTWLPVTAAVAGVAILAITAFVQVPLHAKLSESGRDLATIARLNGNEWSRAFATLVQAACDVAMVAIALRR